MKRREGKPNLMMRTSHSVVATTGRQVWLDWTGLDGHQLVLPGLSVLCLYSGTNRTISPRDHQSMAAHGTHWENAFLSLLCPALSLFPQGKNPILDTISSISLGGKNGKNGHKTQKSTNSNYELWDVKHDFLIEMGSFRLLFLTILFLKGHPMFARQSQSSR